MKKDEKMLKGEDLLRNGTYQKFELTIESAATEERENESGKQTGLMVRFKGARKPLFCPLDKINWRMIRAELGTDDPAQLPGKRLTLIPVKGSWFGERNVLAVRVLVTGDKPKPKIGKKAFGESVVGLVVNQSKVTA